MPRPRYDNIDPEKKARLLEAAMREFAAHGYELASINRILEAAGLSKGSFYYYFDDKADLAATVFLAAAEPEAVLAELQEPVTAEDFWAELRRINVTQLTLLQSRRLQHECISKLGHAFTKEPRFAERVRPRFSAGAHRLTAFLERGVAVGALRSDLPLPTLLALIEAVKTATWKTTFPDERVLLDEELEAYSALVMDLVRRLAHPSAPLAPRTTS